MSVVGFIVFIVSSYIVIAMMTAYCMVRFERLYTLVDRKKDDAVGFAIFWIITIPFTIATRVIRAVFRSAYGLLDYAEANRINHGGY